MRIRDLLERDFSRPIEEIVRVNNDDPDTVFAELTEYIATDRIKAEYERLFSAIAAAAKSPNEGIGVWISGLGGSGKSSFAKNLGYVLANREVLGVSASSLFLKQVESKRVTEYVEFLNRAVPYEIFMFDIQVHLPAETNAEQIAEVMYRVLLRDLDYAEDYEISELEIELENEGKLAAFQDLCRTEYKEEWRKIRKGSQKFARSSALLHRLDPGTYASTETWLNMLKARPSRSLSVKDLVEKMFDRCEVRRRGKTFAFIMDEMGQYVEQGGERLGNLRAVVERFGSENLERVKAGKIPGPAWIIVTAQEKLQDIDNYFAAKNLGLPKLQDRFKHKIDLSAAGLREVATLRVLRKKESQESVLRKLFQDHGASLIQNIKLERCSRRTAFNEDEFVRFYPYLPHLIDLSIDIVVGIQLHPNAPNLGGSNRSIIKQSFEMLVSDRTRLADQPVGVLVSIDKIYELVEGNISQEKQNDILHISQRFDENQDYPGLAARVAKAICLIEFAKTDLPSTTKNIAALLVQRVTDAPRTVPVAEILYLMKEARFIRETEDGWKLYDFDDLRRAADAMEGLKNAVGAINPRPPGWRNDLIQVAKKLIARGLSWYTRPLQEFSTSVTRSIVEIVWTLDHLSTNTAAADHLSTNMVAPMDIVALEGRLALSERRSAAQAESMQQQLELLHEQVKTLISLQNTANPETSGKLATVWDQPARETSQSYIDTGLGIDRTAYLIGLFGTGRRYIHELMLRNIGERAQYIRDTIRVHPGPTPMIYTGHATVRYPSRLQYQPTVTKRILEDVRSRFADLIFIYRHPLDSLLTNWIWWRSYIRDNKSISGISQVHKNTDDLCTDLEQNFFDFETFAAGDPAFFAGAPGPRFLSFAEFVEETELHLQSASLTLRLEDFAIDPFQEFSKIGAVMSVDLDLSRLCVVPPRTNPYGYLAVKDKVPLFRDFINGLSAETKGRIEKIGYNVRI